MQPSQIEEFSLKLQMTPGDAYFLKEGSPHKARQDEDPANSDVIRNPLLQFDLKFDFLRDYLENFTTVLNQHASILNKLQVDVGVKVGQLNLADSLKQCSTSSTLKDRDLEKILLELAGRPLLENSGNAYNDAVNSFCNRLGIFSQGFSHFQKISKELTQKTDKLESDVSKRVDSTFFKVKVKKTKKKLRDEIKESSKVLNERMSEIENKLLGKIDLMEEKLVEVEKQTLWRIKDCEDLLKTRVNDIYVDDAVRKLEEKLKNEIDKITIGKSEGIQKTLDEALGKLKEAEDSTNEKLSQFKKSIKDIETLLFKKIEITKFEEFEKAILAKINTNADEIRTLSRRCEPAVEKVEANMKVTLENVTKISSRIDNLSVTLENYMLIGSVHKSPKKNSDSEPVSSGKITGSERERGGGGGGGGSTVNSKQMIEIQAILGRYRENMDKINDQLMDIQAALRDKVSISTFETELSKKANKGEKPEKTEPEKSPGKFGSPDEEKMKKLGKQIQEIQQKMEKLEELFDKKTAKLKKDLDFNVVLKQLKLKAEEENVQKGFENVDSKIASIAETLQLLKKEIDQSSLVLQKISMQTTYKYQHSNDNASLSTKSIFPQNCLSCGHTAGVANSFYNMQGIDKKWYKGDGDTTVVYENVNMSEIKEGYIHSGIEERSLANGLNMSFDSKITQQRPPRHKVTRLGQMIGAKPRALSKPGILDLSINPLKNVPTASASRPNSAKK